MSPVNNEKLDHVFRPIREEAERRRKAFREAQVPKIHIGMATCGIASGALETKKAFEETLAERNIEALIHPVGVYRSLLCRAYCYHRSSRFRIPAHFLSRSNRGQGPNAGKALLGRGRPSF